MSEQIVYGQNIIYEVLKSGQRKVKEIYLNSVKKEDQAVKEIKDIAQNQKIPIRIVDKQFLEQISHGGLHQGIAAKVTEINIYNIEDLFNSDKFSKEKPFLLVLNNIQDPHNIGALLRTAEACCVHAVIIPSHNAPEINATIIKTSAGASEYVPIVKVSNIAQCLDYLKEKGLWIFGAEEKGSANYYEADYDLPLALVLGNEGSGLQRLVKEKCDFLVNIPMFGKINSLNVSVAGALFMFEICRKRKKMYKC